MNYGDIIRDNVPREVISTAFINRVGHEMFERIGREVSRQPVDKLEAIWKGYEYAKGVEKYETD